jgi:D-3-phosphoglycerate dehydrogenase / 2-oxoglutarate reductase
MKIKFIDCGPAIQEHFFAIKPEFKVPVDVNAEQSPKEIAVMLQGYDICIIDHTRLDGEILESCKNTLRHIVYFGTGAASVVDMPVAERLGIQVHTIHNYGDTTVAEHTMALILAAARQVGPQHESLRAGRWLKLQGIELRNKRLGIIGLGGIGKELARMASGFGMEVVAWSRSGTSGPHWNNLPLDELLRTSDIVSLNLALNEKTRRFLNAERMTLLKDGVILVNTARGALVDEAALIEALKAGRIRHAALDVFETEPLPPDNPLITAPNVTLTSHSGYWTSSSTQNQVRLVLGIIDRLASQTVVA